MDNVIPGEARAPAAGLGKGIQLEKALLDS